MEIIPAENVELTAEEQGQFKKIMWLHLAAGIFFFIQTIMYSVLPVDISVNPTIITPTGCDGPICPSSLTFLGNMNPIFLIPLFVALACVDHLVSYAMCRMAEQRTKWWLFKVGSNPLRWVEYSISASCMAVAISILAGVADIHLWLLIFIMHAVGMAFGAVMELLPKADLSEHTPVSIATVRSICFWLGSVSIFTPWLVIACYFFRAVDKDVPDFVYAAFLGTFILFCTFGANSYLSSIAGKYRFPQAEIIYIILSFTSKTFLAADVFGGLRAAEED